MKEDIIGLGYKNNIVNVKNDYGRNYLIPTGEDIVASPSAKKQLAEDLKQQTSKLATPKAEAGKKIAQLDGVELVIATKVSATGVTCGSVSTATVAEELAKRGIGISRKIVTMRNMKKVSTSEATVHLHEKVEVEIPVTVAARNQPVPAVKEALVEQPAEIPVAEEKTPAAE